ncbi:uncharacterized protein CXorf65 homolog isoform X1 [Nematostella vectensis]|uniref:uncharacterized protein CXorf65 homolog isoform X1 n=1 Tax=Nematostella vectensis TaxID=45351 RepID=UPI00138FCD26|nr:uncharacterized protein CXorf65 homolog isoform X1 [Nematostella vectensis]
MFITVKYGDSQEALFNPNCRTQNLLEDIKRRCLCDKDFVVDLSDELGNVKNLLDHTGNYATDLLKAREKFVLIRVEKKGEESPIYTPLLNDLELITTSFIERLSRPESRMSESGRNTQSRQRRKSSGSSWARARAGILQNSGNKSRDSKKPSSRSTDRKTFASRENSKLGMTI